MYRATPKIVVFLALAAVVGAIYWREFGAPRPQPSVIYVNPNLDSGNP